MENNIDYRKLGKCLREIGVAILEAERKCLKQLGRDVIELGFGGKYNEEYYKKIGSNLWAGATEDDEKTYPHFENYRGGSGSELLDKPKGEIITPAKMKSIRSSSAMTYNLLGNKTIKSKEENGQFADAEYVIEYEKQLYTIRRNLNPANLDAYLYSEEAQEAIFCEMKMMEWVFNKPGTLKGAYEDIDRYFANVPSGEKALAAFQKAIQMLKNEMSCNGMGEHFFRYDAWQMFKHLLGIYNMTSDVTRAEVAVLCQKSEGKIQLIPQCKKIKLVNVVFEPSEECLPSTFRAKYNDILKIEHRDFATFERIMDECGIYEVFKLDCHVDLKILYMSASKFMDCFDLQDREDYLERYRLSKKTY